MIELAPYLGFLHAMFVMGGVAYIIPFYLKQGTQRRHVAMISLSYMLMTICATHTLAYTPQPSWKHVTLAASFIIGQYALWVLLIPKLESEVEPNTDSIRVTPKGLVIIVVAALVCLTIAVVSYTRVPVATARIDAKTERKIQDNTDAVQDLQAAVESHSKQLRAINRKLGIGAAPGAAADETTGP